MQRDRAAWVGAATVVRIDTLEAVDVTFGRGSVATRPIVARLAVSRTWKGEPRDSQTVRLSTTNVRTTCDLALGAGDSYVVFASHGDDGQLQTKRCDGTSRLRDAANIVTVLDSVHPPSPPPASRAPDPPAPSILLASLTGGVATGEKELAWHVAGTMHRSRLALEIRGGIAEASPVMPQDLGPISAREVAALAGISARWRRTLSSARIGAGVVTRIRCVRNCGFFDTAPEVKESKLAVGLAYAVEAGGDARRGSGVARSARQAHSR